MHAHTEITSACFITWFSSSLCFIQALLLLAIRRHIQDTPLCTMHDITVVTTCFPCILRLYSLLPGTLLHGFWYTLAWVLMLNFKASLGQAVGWRMVRNRASLFDKAIRN